MIFGAHVILYTTDADADRAFFRGVLGFGSVDAGHGWLIFALPPAELATHPAETNGRHEFYLMCDNLDNQIEEFRRKGVECTDRIDERWGSLVMINLPSGSQVGLYEPRHPPPLIGN